MKKLDIQLGDGNGKAMAFQGGPGRLEELLRIKGETIGPVHVGLTTAMLCALTPAWAQNEVFKVGPIAAARGEARSGYLEIPAGVDAATKVPITIIHGA